MKWLKQFQDQNKVTLRVRASRPAAQLDASGSGLLAKVYYKCQHNTRPVSKTAVQRDTSKNTNCPALLTLTVMKQKTSFSRLKKKDPLLAEFPTLVDIEHTHNHKLFSADFLRRRDVAETTINKFKALFQKGHSPSSALDMHKMDLQLEHREDYIFHAADRAECPDVQYCHRLYRKIFDKLYGPSTVTDSASLIKGAQERCDAFEKEQRERCCKAKVTDNGKIAIAICTPLMKRVHTSLRSSGEMVFVDASGGLDRYDCRIFLLLTHSATGGLPLGCLIVSAEAADVITEALELYKQLLPPGAFYGRGELGPQLLMTDDSDPERKGLHASWPQATQLLCVFHVLQAAWRFLWEARNSVVKADRPHLLSVIKNIVYAPDEDAMRQVFDDACLDDTVTRYPKFNDYLQKQYSRRHMWAICLRKDMATRGNATNNYCEAAMRILKDKIFCRTRAYNLNQLMDFLLTRLSAYYERRLLDLANGIQDVTLSRRFFMTDCVLTKDMIKQVNDHLFEVQSETEPDKTPTQTCVLVPKASVVHPANTSLQLQNSSKFPR